MEEAVERKPGEAGSLPGMSHWEPKVGREHHPQEMLSASAHVPQVPATKSLPLAPLLLHLAQVAITNVKKVLSAPLLWGWRMIGGFPKQWGWG